MLALDDLFVIARQHTAAAAYAVNALPIEIMLLAMLPEEHKEVMQLRIALEKLENDIKNPPIRTSTLSHIQSSIIISIKL